ncbi:hypothetical protein A0128_12860 [Leptospira tipperaryensis]|uniref:Uncharacterized protein n=1 Tax=Leptospira tipperaryensis TaxID=2564040 RepID=A0A1D7UYN3_9LEPT|nr:hypothetical protein A0128_12860 [Leptospira tipperaryensis]
MYWKEIRRTQSILVLFGYFVHKIWASSSNLLKGLFVRPKWKMRLPVFKKNPNSFFFVIAFPLLGEFGFSFHLFRS